MCCVSDCGRCGGSDCRTGAENVGLTADDCCVGKIEEAGIYCDDSGTAPCILSGSGSGERYMSRVGI